MAQEYDDEFQKLAAEIEARSPYRKNTAEKKVMTVREMGDLLGLKKTERYWLVHKGVFRTEMINGQMFVDVLSFEKWYANQVKHKKVNGEEPGLELKAWTYSPQELCEMLGLTSDIVYDLLIKDDIETITVDYWKRIPKKAFDEWYAGQTKYRNAKDRQKDAPMVAATITMPEMARLLGISRQKVYGILKSKKYKDLFEFVMIADRKRITKESFQRFLEGQEQYRLCRRHEYEEAVLPDQTALADFKRNTLAKSERKTVEDNGDYLTRAQAAALAGVTCTTISDWLHSGYFSGIHMGDLIRIPRAEYLHWLEKRYGKEEGAANGIDQKARR